MAGSKKPKDPKSLATLCAKLAAEKNAKDIHVLNIQEVDGAPCDWFVIASASSDPQIRSMAENMISATKKLDIEVPRSEGWDSLNWIIVDYFDVVVHLMKEEAREYYKLEKLWSDAQFFKLSAAGRLLKFDPLKDKKSKTKKVQELDEEFED